MGQSNLKRTQFVPRAVITTLLDSNVHTLDFIGYFENDDKVDVVDVDANGNIVGTIQDDMTILAINPVTKKVTLDASVDTSSATGTPMLRAQEIDDGQEAIDRLYRRQVKGPIAFDVQQNILEARPDIPSVGKTTYFVDDVAFWKIGQTGKVLDDNGVVLALTTIEAVNVNADDTNFKSSIVISNTQDVTLLNNPYLQNLSITQSDAIKYNQERQDESDRPIPNQDMGVGNGSHLAFAFPDLILQNSSHLYLDSGRKKLGTAGTRAGLVQGAGDSALTLSSMILGLEGNKTTVEVVAGAGVNVSVAGNSKNGYVIQVTDNTGAVTSKEVADAINADADAKRIVQAIYGGNGTGVVATFGPSAMAGGLDDGTFDYAELEQVWENKNTGTGLKWASFHIRKNERNRMNSAPDNDEEITADYSRASVNVDR
jgi:hypothetical protein